MISHQHIGASAATRQQKALKEFDNNLAVVKLSVEAAKAHGATQIEVSMTKAQTDLFAARQNAVEAFDKARKQLVNQQKSVINAAVGQNL